MRPTRDLLSVCCALMICFAFDSTKALRIRRLDVPSAVKNGSSIYLSCEYSLQDGENLYSVKWYKNHVEFYRYLPANDPFPGQILRLKGIHVDLHGSNSTHVFLYRVDLYSEGTYSCEVSTDQFITATAIKQMKVYVLPQEKLKIEGSEFEYDVGHLINLTCISAQSKPAAQLTWYINGRKAPSTLLIRYPTVLHFNQMESSRLGLIFQTRSSDFVNGQLRLRCTAGIVLSYRFEASQELEGSKNKEEKTRILHGPNTPSDLVLQQTETPIISGMKSSYRVGDSLNLNCSTRSKDAQLKWYIDEEQANTNQLIHYGSKINSNSSPNSLFSAHQNSGAYYESAASLRSSSLKRRAFSDQRNRSARLRSDLDTGTSNSIVDSTENTLGLRLNLKQSHFQSDVQLKCVAVYFKQMALFEETLRIATENPELLTAQSSSHDLFGNSTSCPFNTGIHWLFSTLICYYFITMYHKSTRLQII